MTATIYLLIFILGSIIGSFLNVVILRFGKEDFVKGSSRCPKCKKDLKWYNLIPIFSFIFQHGKCSDCHKKISIQYPIVEFATGLLFVLNFIKIFGTTFPSFSTSYFLLFTSFYLLTTIAISLLIIIFVYDLYHKIIPDVFSYSFNFLSLIFLVTVFYTQQSIFGFDFRALDLLAPLFFFVPFFLLWRLSNGRLIGLGDGKLAFGFGGFLGIAYGLSALFLSFWIGAIFAVGLMIINRLKDKGANITMKTEIPFGPFMIIAFLLVYLLEIDVTGLASLFNL